MCGTHQPRVLTVTYNFYIVKESCSQTFTGRNSLSQLLRFGCLARGRRCASWLTLQRPSTIAGDAREWVASVAARSACAYFDGSIISVRRGAAKEADESKAAAVGCSSALGDELLLAADDSHAWAVLLQRQ